MSRVHGILSRISQGRTKSPYSLLMDEEAYVYSVQQNIERMLNVRQGSVPHLPDFGLPDFNDLVFEFPDALVQLVRAVEHYLLKFEPRVSKVRVSFQHPSPDPLIILLRVEAEILVASGLRNLIFATVLTGAGHAYIQRAS